MNVPTFEFIDHDDDRERLSGFLAWLGRFLDELLSELRKPSDKVFESELPGDIVESVFGAWGEIRKREVLERAIHVQMEMPRNTLEQSGLTGSQLSAKLRVLRWLGMRFARSRTGATLRRLLGMVNSLLGSLAEANPFVHALKEFKEVLESLVREER